MQEQEFARRSSWKTSNTEMQSNNKDKLLLTSMNDLQKF